eukprot:g8132.t1
MARNRGAVVAVRGGATFELNPAEDQKREEKPAKRRKVEAAEGEPTAAAEEKKERRRKWIAEKMAARRPAARHLKSSEQRAKKRAPKMPQKFPRWSARRCTNAPKAQRASWMRKGVGRAEDAVEPVGVVAAKRNRVQVPRSNCAIGLLSMARAPSRNSTSTARGLKVNAEEKPARMNSTPPEGNATAWKGSEQDQAADSHAQARSQFTALPQVSATTFLPPGGHGHASRQR